MVGAFLLADLGALLYANNRVGPPRLTPPVFIDGFATVFGRHPGIRSNHAKGVAVTRHFDGNGNGSELFKAAVFRPGRTPVIGRFSLSGGDPQTADAPTAARGLGLAFGFPGAQQWRTAMLNLPVFLDNSSQGCYDRLIASAVKPGTGKPDPAAMSRFLAAHPETRRAMKIVKPHPPTRGFADSTYHGLHAFYFVNESNLRTPVRWALLPMQPALPPAPGHNALFDALVRQLRSGPLRWRLMLTVGAVSDPVRDPTLPWPADRRAVDAGVLTLTSAQTEHRGNARDINFDPLILPDGIEPSDDPLLSARSAVYAASYRRRAGETAANPPAVEVGHGAAMTAPEPRRYSPLTRTLHWLTAALVLSALFVGFVMVNSVTDYARLVVIHKTLGVTIFAVMLVRIVNRLTHRPPALPSTVGTLERKLAMASELVLYALLVTQPLLGWAMLSAGSGLVVVLGSLRLPRIAPCDARLFWLLRQCHSIVAYALMTVIAAHVSAIVAHTVTLRDRMLSRMTFALTSARRLGRPLRVIAGGDTKGG
ncbi:catalase [Mycobacterium xenopi RIVM700367]|nr:catalase [Mycobacterium xenopi RIVM700367]